MANFKRVVIQKPTEGANGVDSFNSRVGPVLSVVGDYTTGQVLEVTDKKYVTDAEKTVIGNTSNTNTGDQDLSGLAIKATLTQDSGNVTGTINTDANTFTLTSSVDSVNGKTGVVVLDGTDIETETGSGETITESLRVLNEDSIIGLDKYIETNTTFFAFTDKISQYVLNDFDFSCNIQLGLGIGSAQDQYFINLGNFGGATNVSGLYIRYQKSNGKVKIGYKSNDNLTNINGEDSNIYDVGDVLNVDFSGGILVVNGNQVVDWSANNYLSDTLGTESYFYYGSQVGIPHCRINAFKSGADEMLISNKDIFCLTNEIILNDKQKIRVYGEGIQDLKVTIDNSSNNEITVSDGQMSHFFKYTIDVGNQQKLWRYVGAVSIEKNPRTMLTTGDSEGVYQVVGAPDFSGGVHGDEEFIVADFYLDGKKIDVSKDAIYFCDKIERYYLTDIYTAGGVPAYELESKRYSFFRIKKNEISYDLKFTFQKNLNIGVIYMGMSSLDKAFSEVFTDDGYLIPDSLGTLYDYKSFITNSIFLDFCTSETKIRYKNTPTGFDNGLRIFGSTPYNKIYYGMFTPLNIVIGDIYECNYSTRFDFI